ncbi:uncharacterized protein LOC120415051 [Culex pipiens pallens]|uniref:uncharacterized protein LOC120415051 n=1 Tax=Culex pipiens pallens TaxID=42434 RepID=UPI00195407CE|nr:uncharacterized protein LOC120415051 [Culex pipiens pallens]
MNGSLHVEIIECQPGETISDCNDRLFDPRLCSFSIGRWFSSTPKYCAPLIPMHSLTIMIPNGTPLTEYALLLSPYSKSCWIIILCFTFINASLIRILWRRSIVESLLLTICKLNGSSLKHKATLEKLVTLAAILVAFIILAAYEAKISSYLANWPYRQDVKTLQDLREANIQVLIDSHSVLLANEKDHWLRNRLVTMDSKSLLATITTANNVAFVLERYSAKIILRQTTFIDGLANRPRYVMLEDPVDTSLTFYNFGNRNSFFARFVQLQNRIYEAGLDQHWMELIVASLSGLKNMDSTPKMIQLEQLQHLQSILFFLWFCSVLVLLLELGYARIRSLFLRIGQRRKVEVMHPRMRAFTYPFMKQARWKKTNRKSI